MYKNETIQMINEVFKELYKILSLYEATAGFQKMPGDGKGDVLELMEGKLMIARMKADIPFLQSQKISEKLQNIINETEYAVKNCEVPGTVLRWKQLNPKLQYFDCAFDVMEAMGREEYLLMQRGLSQVTLNLYPDEEMIKERREYFESFEEKSKKYHINYTNERIYQEEMLRTLKIVFRNDLQEYLLK